MESSEMHTQGRQMAGTPYFVILGQNLVVYYTFEICCDFTKFQCNSLQLAKFCRGSFKARRVYLGTVVRGQWRV